MNTIDDTNQSYTLVKQSKVRKLSTYASSTSSSSFSGSSANNSPIVDKQKAYHRHHHYPRQRHYHHNGDTDEGYASFTTNSTTLASNSSTTLNRDDSAYCTSASERLLTATNSSSSSCSKFVVESDSDKSESSDEDDALKELVDWPSLNKQVQTLVSRLDKWLHNPLPERSIPVERSYVEHAYPILNRRASSIPLAINLAGRESDKISPQTNCVINFVQNNDIPPQQKPVRKFGIPRPHVHFNLPVEQVFLSKKKKKINKLFINYLLSLSCSFNIVPLVQGLFN